MNSWALGFLDSWTLGLLGCFAVRVDCASRCASWCASSAPWQSRDVTATSLKTAASLPSALHHIPFEPGQVWEIRVVEGTFHAEPIHTSPAVGRTTTCYQV